MGMTDREIEDLKARLAAVEGELAEAVASQRSLCGVVAKREAELNAAQFRVWLLATLLNLVVEACHGKPAAPDGTGERLRACARELVEWMNLPAVCLEDLPERVRTGARAYADTIGFVVLPPPGKVAG